MTDQPQKNETTEQVSEMQGSTSPIEEEEQTAAAAAAMELYERLFAYAMKDLWEEVVKVCKEKPKSLTAKITYSEDTALHLAISGGKLDFMCEMVGILGEDASTVLKAKNKRGNTPLHTAATLGNAPMCRWIVLKDPRLIAERNKKNETPLHLAAQLGHKDAFLCLSFGYQQDLSDTICSKDKNGDTILHAAIRGEHFDLAFQIICKYPQLVDSFNANGVDSFNANGVTPLHILATKANAFQSGSRLGLFDRILYRCVIVDELKDAEYFDDKDYLKRFDKKGSDHRRPSFPENYDSCVRFCRMFFNVVCYAMPRDNSFLHATHVPHAQGGSNRTSDEENPQGKKKTTQDESSSSQIKPESNNAIAAVQVSSDTRIGASPEAKKGGEDESHSPERNRQTYFPDNYATFIKFFKFMMKFLLVVLGLGFHRIKKITRKKQRHTWASQVMNKLIDKASMYKFSGGSHQDTNTANGKNKQGESQNETDSSKKERKDAMVKFLREYHIIGSVDSKTSKLGVQMKFEKKADSKSTKLGTPSPTSILIAASKGITEMVDKILERYPVAIQDVDAEGKNVMLLAVEHRQAHTFQFLMEREILHESVFRHSDNQGNNALHLAATYGRYRPWLIPGSALQMQWELKWYKFVKKSMAKYLLGHYNIKGQTPKQIFTETHKALVKEGSEWLTKTSESCSVVAALIATVAFATAASIPGGVDQGSGKPVLRDEPAFGAFALSSLVALCFSITALVFFLAILTSRFEEKDFAKKLPRKLIVGLTSLFASIAAMLVSFCAGHFFELKDKLKIAALPIYAATCLPVSFFALAQLPLYFDLLRAIYKKVPQRSYKEFSS